jgi:hypothetical protein
LINKKRHILHYTSHNAKANKQAESKATEAPKNCTGPPFAAELEVELVVLAAEEVLELFEEDVLEAVLFEDVVDVTTLVNAALDEDVVDVVGPVAEGVRRFADDAVDDAVVEAVVVDAVTVLPDAVVTEVEDVETEPEIELLVELEELSEPPVRWKGYDSWNSVIGFPSRVRLRPYVANVPTADVMVQL